MFDQPAENTTDENVDRGKSLPWQLICNSYLFLLQLAKQYCKIDGFRRILEEAQRNISMTCFRQSTQAVHFLFEVIARRDFETEFMFFFFNVRNLFYDFSRLGYP